MGREETGTNINYALERIAYQFLRRPKSAILVAKGFEAATSARRTVIVRYSSGIPWNRKKSRDGGTLLKRWANALTSAQTVGQDRRTACRD